MLIHKPLNSTNRARNCFSGFPFSLQSQDIAFFHYLPSTSVCCVFLATLLSFISSVLSLFLSLSPLNICAFFFTFLTLFSFLQIPIAFFYPLDFYIFRISIFFFPPSHYIAFAFYLHFYLFLSSSSFSSFSYVNLSSWPPPYNEKFPK